MNLNLVKETSSGENYNLLSNKNESEDRLAWRGLVTLSVTKHLQANHVEIFEKWNIKKKKNSFAQKHIFGGGGAEKKCLLMFRIFYFGVFFPTGCFYGCS